MPGERVPLADVRLVAEGLDFPEGPVALADGSILLVEIRRGTLTRIGPDGTVVQVIECGTGPNGAAIGPDGAVYVCDNGGYETAYRGGRILRADLETEAVEVLYEACDGQPLSGPNDLVFESSGAFWFTDNGKFHDHGRDYGRIYYAAADGSSITQVMDRVDTPNGIGLSPDQQTLYFAETLTGRLYRRAIVGPGTLEHDRIHDPETLVCGLPGVQMFDSLAVDAGGNICLGTLISGCLTVVSPDGGSVTQYTLPDPFADPMPTNLCFAGVGLDTAYITLSETGRLIAAPWPTGGLRLAFER